MPPRVLAVSQRADRLGELPHTRLDGVSIDAIRGAACVWTDDPGVLSQIENAGVPVVLSEAQPARWPSLRSSRALIGGTGVGVLAVARMIGQLRGEALGPLERLAIREPGGKRQPPAASKRTAFHDGRVRWELDGAALARMTAIAAPYWRLAEMLVPGSASSLAISELISNEGKERIVAHAPKIVVEIDREVRGDEAWEVEALCARGTMLARAKDGRDVLITRSPLRREERTSNERSPDELLVRHAISGQRALGAASEAALAYEACEAALRGAAARATSRPISIALVHLPRFRNRYDELRLPSLAIARLAAFMRGYGFETRVVDLGLAELDLGAFVDDARVDAWLGGGPDAAIDAAIEALWPSIAPAIDERTLVGLSIVDYFGHFQMNLASAVARTVRERTGRPVVLGGERDQVDGDRALAPAMPFDYVVDGDGEAALLELASLCAYRDRDARYIEAVWSRHGESVVKNPIVRSHLNAMPRPDFDGVPLDRYRRAPSAWLLEALARDGHPIRDTGAFAYLPYGFVKGCTADCTFCSAKEHLDVQAPEKSIDELLALSERYGVRDFVFLDNLVNLGAKWLERFCRGLVDSKAGLQWTDSCRPTGIGPELAALMRESGCLLLNYGAESGSDAILERMQKGLGRADILSTLRATHGAGIVNRVNLIAGYFHETDRDVDLTISLVEELEEQIDVIGCFQGFYLFPGMGVDPARENIVVRDGLDRLKTGQTTMAYDEIGGLRWEEKRDKIDASRNRILRRIEELGIRTIDKIDEHDLFWISRTYRDKALTRRYLLRDPDPRANERALLPPGGQRGRVPMEGAGG